MRRGYEACRSGQGHIQSSGSDGCGSGPGRAGTNGRRALPNSLPAAEARKKQGRRFTIYSRFSRALRPKKASPVRIQRPVTGGAELPKLHNSVHVASRHRPLANARSSILTPCPNLIVHPNRWGILTTCFCPELSIPDLIPPAAPHAQDWRDIKGQVSKRVPDIIYW